MKIMSNKVVIISGGSRGIGKALALQLAQLNYRVVIAYAKNKQAAEQVVQTIQSHQGVAFAVQTDISNMNEVKNLFSFTLEQFGKIDAVVNTAGIAILKPLIEFTETEFQSILHNNITGTFNILHQAAQHVSEHGRILTFSSNVTETLPPNYAPYAASKAAVEAMTKVLAKELRGKSISINVLSPGPTTTEMFLDGKSTETIEAFKNMSPLERLGQPEDIVNVVSFLLSQEGAWINGQVLKVNGGLI
jgi:3-oxoacyl-[acyl-carrier protein] reductase